LLLDTGEFGRILWRWSLGVAVAAVATELLPVLFGTGEEVTWDWSFSYVTVRFVLLPAFCAVHLLLGAIFIVRWIRQRPPVSVAPAVSVLVSAGYLLALRIYPLPWFAGAP
jgi:hypothetical protein